MKEHFWLKWDRCPRASRAPSAPSKSQTPLFRAHCSLLCKHSRRSEREAPEETGQGWTSWLCCLPASGSNTPATPWFWVLWHQNKPRLASSLGMSDSTTTILSNINRALKEKKKLLKGFISCHIRPRTPRLHLEEPQDPAGHSPCLLLQPQLLALSLAPTLWPHSLQVPLPPHCPK